MPCTRLLLFCLWMFGLGQLAAHTVPSLEVEAEFTPDRQITLHVNLDARLYLTDQPTTLPPVPPSWWFDQNEAAHDQNRAAARAYVTRIFTFFAGKEKLTPTWEVIAIESPSNLPLQKNSAEAHLLCEYRGKLPDAAENFRVVIAESCAVGVILLNSMEGEPERHPQSLFPGESSRPFPLPKGNPASTAAATPSGTPLNASAEISPEKPSLHQSLAESVLMSWISLHLSVGDVLWILLIAIALQGRVGAMLLAVTVVHAGMAFGAFATSTWLPEGPEWLRWVGWVVMLGSAALLFGKGFHQVFKSALVLAGMAGVLWGWVAAATTLPRFSGIPQWLQSDVGPLTLHLAWAVVVCLCCKVLLSARGNQAEA